MAARAARLHRCAPTACAQRVEPVEHPRRRGGQHEVRLQRDDAFDLRVFEATQPRQALDLRRPVRKPVDADQPVAAPEGTDGLGR